MATGEGKARRCYGAFSRGRIVTGRRDLWPDDGECRPLAQHRRDVDRSAVGADDALREREAQAGPLLLRFRREERLEEFLEASGGMPGPVSWTRIPRASFAKKMKRGAKGDRVALRP